MWETLNFCKTEKKNHESVRPVLENFIQTNWKNCIWFPSLQMGAPETWMNMSGLPWHKRMDSVCNKRRVAIKTKKHGEMRELPEREQPNSQDMNESMMLSSFIFFNTTTTTRYSCSPRPNQVEISVPSPTQCGPKTSPNSGWKFRPKVLLGHAKE